jgi:expansin (peptidoglycan-binding protein)
VTGPVAYQFKQGSSQWWTAVQARNHRVPIRSLVWNKGGTWIDVQRANYNYFVEAAGMGTGAVRLRIVSWDGQTLEDTVPGVMENQTFAGAAQFK